LGSGGAAGGNGGGGQGASGGGTAGTANTGGGGGANSGAGGSGIVIVRYLTSDAAIASGGVATIDGSYTVRTFTSSGTLSLTRMLAGMPVNTETPVISGTTIGIGNVLTCTTGTWTGDPTITYAYQWKRNGTNIAGSTSSTYTTAIADAWQTITCMVTATNSVTSVTSTSNSLTISVISYTTVDTTIGISPKLTPVVTSGGNITVAEAVSLNLTTATTTDIEEVNNLVKLTPVITSGGNITVAEAVALNLTTATTTDIEEVNNLVKLAANYVTSYAVTDGVPIAMGNNSSSSSGTTTTLSQLWYMG
jgi:hypothetical protein